MIISQIMEAAEDYMYNPGKEEFMFAHLLQRLSEAGDDDMLVSGLGFLQALLYTQHAGKYADMVRAHFASPAFAAKFKVPTAPCRFQNKSCVSSSV